MKMSNWLLAALVLATGSGTRVLADDIMIGPGETLSLDNDLVLSGGDFLVINGSADNPCRLAGNEHSIYTDGWTGFIFIQNCQIESLGTQSFLSAPGNPALELDVYGAGDVTVVNSTFSQCNQFLLKNWDDSTAAFQGNTWLGDGTYYIDYNAYGSQDCLTADGDSPGRKAFQGNTVLKGRLTFASSNWLIGGDTDQDGNLLSGFRCGIQSWGDGNVAKHNYIHVDMTTDPINYPYWSQVTTVIGSFPEFSHNITNTGAWMWRDVSGEFHHNLSVNVEAFAFIQTGTAHIHDNIFTHGLVAPNLPPAHAFLELYIPGDQCEVHNNVFDASGNADRITAVVGVKLGEGTWVSSLRNNVFYGFRIDAFAVGPEDGEDWGVDRLGYADYNLFHASQASVQNYAANVPGLTVRQDPGFGFFDVFAGDGIVDEKADPMFQGPVPDAFNFNEDDILSRRVTVSDILNYYFHVYSPAEGSPLIGAGDPQDGPGTNIGIRP